MEFPRPPKKKTRVLAKAQALGEQAGLIEAEAKTFKNKKAFIVWLKRRLEDIVENIDPLEMIAVAGLTVLVKQGIEWTENIPISVFDKNSLVRSFIRFVPIIGLIADVGVPELPQEAREGLEKALDMPQVEFLQWLISFVIAFVIVRHAGQIIEAGGNLLGVAKGLIGGMPLT